MPFPLPLGAGSFGGPGVADFHELLRRLQGEGAYSTEADSVRDLELLALANALLAGSVDIDRAGAQALQTRATELLEEWEREYRLPNDAARTIQERQARLVAAERATGGASRTRVEAALAAIVESATLRANIRTQVARDDAEDTTILQAAVVLSEVDFDDPQTRRSLTRLLARVLPARSRGQHGVAAADRVLVVKEDARWASATHELDRDCIRQQTASQYSAPGFPARHRSYGPLSRLDADDLNAIQDLSLWQEANGSDMENHPTAEAGGHQVAFAVGEISASGGVAEVDASIDWRDRLVMLCSAVDTSDIQPGQAGDSAIPTAGTRFEGLFYTGLGGLAYSMELASQVDLFVDAGTGVLNIQNGSGSGQWVVGFAIATEELGSR